MTDEQFQALKLWVEAKATEIADERLGRNTLSESIRSDELEKEARALLVMETYNDD